MTRRAKILLPVGLVILVGLSAARLLRDGGASAIHEFTGYTMGTTYSVKVVEPGMTAARQAAIDSSVAATLSEVNSLMSTYDSASELSRFNAHNDTTAFPVSHYLLDVFSIARQVSLGSGGAFDVTVAPLVNAWGFGPGGNRDAPPSEALLRELEARVGYDRIEIDHDALTLRKLHPDVTADLSAVAKGYGVDLVAIRLHQLGVDDLLVEIGGEVRGDGHKPDGSDWQVAIEVPDSRTRAVYRPLPISDLAVATSGDYRNYYERDGVRLAHIIDPRTGRPAQHSGASVTVVDTSAAVADAWATALSVLGPDEGLDLASEEGLAAFFIRRTETGLEGTGTPAFTNRFGRNGADR
jgi:FAD:protein FMN transferase